MGPGMIGLPLGPAQGMGSDCGGALGTAADVTCPCLLPIWREEDGPLPTPVFGAAGGGWQGWGLLVLFV